LRQLAMKAGLVVGAAGVHFKHEAVNTSSQ